MQIDFTNGILEREVKEEGPKQKLLFFLLGNASLLSFNIFINAIDIYQRVTSRSDIGLMINRAYNIPCSLTALLLCFYKPKNPKVIISEALFSLTLIMCFLPTILFLSYQPDTLYILTMVGVGLSAVVSSLIFSCTYSFSSQFGEEASAATSSGNGCSGVIAAFLRILTKAAFSSHEKASSAAYLFLSAAINLATMIFFLIKSKEPSVEKRLTVPPSDNDRVFSRESLEVIGLIWTQWAGVFIDFCITLTIFPGYIAAIHQPSYLGDWTPIIVTTLFCIFDWVGRWLPSKKMYPSLTKSWIPNVIRILFFAVFIISIQKVVNCGEPFWTFCWTIPFALTNGYCGTVSFIYGSNHPSLSMSQRRYASFLISFAENAGILLAMALTVAMPTPPQ